MHHGSERLVFVDVETAGLETWRPIIQIAAIAVSSSLQERETLERKILFDEREAAPEALRKNHYSSKRWWSEGLPAHVVANDFARFLKRHATLDLPSRSGRFYQVAQLVAHNAAFDGPFLKAWYERQRLFLPGGYRLLCTLQRAIWLFHEDKTLTPPEDFKLATLCEYFGVRLKEEDAHDALADVRATVELYRAMMAWTVRGRVAA